MFLITFLLSMTYRTKTRIYTAVLQLSNLINDTECSTESPHVVPKQIYYANSANYTVSQK